MTNAYKPSLYLAGPIFGCTEGEAKDWRNHVAAQLPWVRCISPLRCEPMIGQRYDVAYNDPCFGAPKAIVAKNFLDLRQCDMTLAYFPAPAETEELLGVAEMLRHDARGEYEQAADTIERIARKSPQRSIGTIGEISWCYALRKPCIVVSDDPLIKTHPFTSVQPDWPVLPDLDHAIRLIEGIWTDYAK